VPVEPPDFIRPRYGQGCFADLPQTIRHLLTGQGAAGLVEGRYQKVVLFFIDAFGWRFFAPRRERYAFLRHFDERGTVEQITAQFPSTTAAHVTCIQTGLPPVQSGVFEWQYYEPEADGIIKPLLYAMGDSPDRGSLEIAPEKILPPGTLYQELAKAGVACHIFQPGEHFKSPYSQWTFRGAETHPYRTLPSALTNLRLLLDAVEGPAYFFLYFDGIDGVGHDHGPESPQFAAEVDALLHNADRLFLQQVAGQHEDALLLVTADHGMIEVDPNTTVYIDERAEFAGYERFLRRNKKGAFLAPAGSPRDMFLYIEDGLLEEAQGFFAARLAGRAEVRRVGEMVAEGYFGPGPVSEKFIARAGDLVILPYAGETVWWWGGGDYEQQFYGNHGGLTRDEMETPLLACELGR
jgi:predicted AlkP superfamily pyrophosphatase or phosphodiesterase